MSSPISIIKAGPWSKHPGNPLIGGKFEAARGAETAGVALSEFGFTPCSVNGAGSIVTLAGKTGFRLASTETAWYVRDDDYNRGRIAGIAFSYATAPAVGAVAYLGRKIVDGPNGLCGYVLTLRHSGSNVFAVDVHRWDDGVAHLLGSKTATLAPNVEYELYLATNTMQSKYTPTPAVMLRRASDYSYLIGTGTSAMSYLSDFTYSGTAHDGIDFSTLFGLAQTDALAVRYFDSGVDGWYQAYVCPIMVKGEYDNVWRDALDRVHAVYQAGDASSLDQSAWLRTDPGASPVFTDGMQTYKGVSGHVGAVIRAAEREGGVWPSGTSELMGKAQQTYGFYDPDTDEIRVFYCTDEGLETYRMFCAVCASPDANDPSDPENWTYLGQVTIGSGSTDDMGCSVVKRDVVVGGTTYHYVMGLKRNYYYAWIAYSVDGYTSWVLGPQISTAQLSAFCRLGYDVEAGKWFALIQSSKSTGIGQTELYTSVAGAGGEPTTWVREGVDVGPTSGALGEWDYRWRYDSQLVKEGSSWYWQYAGDPLIPGTSVNWPNLHAGLATYTEPAGQAEPVLYLRDDLSIAESNSSGEETLTSPGTYDGWDGIRARVLKDGELLGVSDVVVPGSALEAQSLPVWLPATDFELGDELSVEIEGYNADTGAWYTLATFESGPLAWDSLALARAVVSIFSRIYYQAGTDATYVELVFGGATRPASISDITIIRISGYTLLADPATSELVESYVLFASPATGIYSLFALPTTDPPYEEADPTATRGAILRAQVPRQGVRLRGEVPRLVARRRV